MQIDNLNDVRNLFIDMNELFNNIDEISKKLANDLILKEYERDDLLHEIELSKLNAIERMSIYSKLETVLQERREIKDKIEFINTVKGFANKFITKGICADLKTGIENINRLEENRQVREYTPRILKDLKCAKKKKETEK